MGIKKLSFSSFSSSFSAFFLFYRLLINRFIWHALEPVTSWSHLWMCCNCLSLRIKISSKSIVWSCYSPALNFISLSKPWSCFFLSSVKLSFLLMLNLKFWLNPRFMICLICLVFSGLKTFHISTFTNWPFWYNQLLNCWDILIGNNIINILIKGFFGLYCS